MVVKDLIRQNPTDPLAGIVGSGVFVASFFGFFEWAGPACVGRPFQPDEVAMLGTAIFILAASIRTLRTGRGASS